MIREREITARCKDNFRSENKQVGMYGLCPKDYTPNTTIQRGRPPLSRGWEEGGCDSPVVVMSTGRSFQGPPLCVGRGGGRSRARKGCQWKSLNCSNRQQQKHILTFPLQLQRKLSSNPYRKYQQCKGIFSAESRLFGTKKRIFGPFQRSYFLSEFGPWTPIMSIPRRM